MHCPWPELSDRQFTFLVSSDHPLPLALFSAPHSAAHGFPKAVWTNERLIAKMQCILVDRDHIFALHLKKSSFLWHFYSFRRKIYDGQRLNLISNSATIFSFVTFLCCSGTSLTILIIIFPVSEILPGCKRNVLLPPHVRAADRPPKQCRHVSWRWGALTAFIQAAWSYSLLGVLASCFTWWWSEARMPHTAKFTPSDHPETRSTWWHATIFKHAVIGIARAHATPRFSLAGAVRPSPTLLNPAGSRSVLALEHQVSMNIQKGF